MDFDVCCEFGYELALVLPYIYYIHVSGKLNSTISSKNTKELYYFSEKHVEKYDIRKFKRIDKLPNTTLSQDTFNYEEYLPPPYKKVFKNEEFIFEKPLLIIQNKYNTEWGGPPINFIDVNTLSKIFELCHNRYTIVYNRPKSKNIINDNSLHLDLDELNILKKYDIIDANDLYERYECKYNFNHFQLLLHANCDHFISVQGGTSAFCCYFGGTNIIFGRRGPEIEYGLYQSLFKKLSGSEIFHTDNYSSLIHLVKENYLK